MAEATQFKYRAFLSYSHRDKAWGKWLHSTLEGYRIDKDLVGRDTAVGPVPKTLRPIFRDREDFSAGHSLTAQALAALEASQFLIVICSPNAAQSKYVNEEVRHFKMMGRADRVIPVIIDGEPGDPTRECFPPAVLFGLQFNGAMNEERVEPIAADARHQGDGKELAKQKVVAGLLALGLDEIVRRTERARGRRNRFWSALAGVFLVLAVAAGGSAVYAWRQLKTNEAFLSGALKRATAIIDEAVAQAEKYNVPRAATLNLLARAEDLFDDMAQYGRSTSELRYRKAWMLIQFARNYEILGDTSKQFARANEAHRLLAGLAAEKPNDITYQTDLSVAYGGVGDVLFAQGKLEDALSAYRDSLAVAERLATTDPNNTNWQRLLRIPLASIAEVFKAQGKLDGALKAHREALTITKRIATANDSPITWERDAMASSYDRIGDVLLAQGKLEEALTAHRESLAITGRAATADPSNLQRQRNLSTSYGKVGTVLMAQGKLDEAVKAHREALTIAERLAATDQSNTQWQRDLAVTYCEVGRLLRTQGNVEPALSAFHVTIAIFKRLVAQDSSKAEWQRGLAVSYGEIGDLLNVQGKLDEALSAYDESLGISKRLVAQDSTNAEWRHDLVNTSLRIGGMILAQGKPEEALELYRYALSILKADVDADRRDSAWQEQLSFSYGRIGDALKAQGQLDEALRAYRQSLTIRERLAAADQSNNKRQRDLWISYALVGEVSTAKGNLDEALKAYRESLVIVERLAATDPSNTQPQADLQTIIARIGSLAYSFVLAGEFQRAQEVAEKAFSLAPNMKWISINRAHALMLLGRVGEARAAYFRFRGEQMQNGKTWDSVVLEDFLELRKAGLTHPLMDEIEKRFAAAG